VDDLVAWLRQLDGCPSITNAVVARCTQPQHEDDPGTWFYVEADSTEGVARRRCLACGQVHALLDSEERWTYPPTFSCRNCGQSIMEVATGLHVEDDDRVTWAALGVRCVNCGDLAGVADFVVNQPLEAALAQF
jgi:hypothetical protein